jgi:hypothetical protein
MMDVKMETQPEKGSQEYSGGRGGCTRRMPTPSTLADELMEQLDFLERMAGLGGHQKRPSSVIEMRLAALRKAVEEERMRLRMGKEAAPQRGRRGRHQRVVEGATVEVIEETEVYNATAERRR